ncbi:MAG: hypothetical protein HRF50_08005 [Phycisphaerae bacterium]|jgi:hypothetical protein
MSRFRPLMLALLVVLARGEESQVTAPGAEARPAARIDYQLTYDPAPDAMRWEVRMAVSGLDPADRSILIALPDWGGWPSIDSLYLRALQGTPPLRPHEGSSEALAVDVPNGWDGSIEISYHIPVMARESRAHEAYGLLPWHSEPAGYASGFSENTLMRVLRDGRPIDARRTITIHAPEGVAIVSGWSGEAVTKQAITLDQDVGNAQLLFGRMTGRAFGRAGAIPVEVFQFGAGSDVTGELLPLFTALIEAYTRSTGCGLTRPARMFLTDTGGGGTRVDWNFNVGISSDTDLQSPEFKQLVAHEVFHEWLGGMISEDRPEAYVWFKEGFTDYLATWHLVATGQVSADWFAERMLTLERIARSSPAYGQVKFGATDVNWRDSDGPNETLAYKGGALLAFFADGELHRRGRSRLASMISQMRAEPGGKYSLDSIRRWFESQQLVELYAAHVASAALPDAGAALVTIGYDAAPKPVELAYVGIATENDEVFGKVVGLDPDGPAARAGIQVGDRISGFFPSREPEVRLDESELVAGTPRARDFPYALTRLAPGATGTYIGVVRPGPAGAGNQELQVMLDPRPIPGGRVDAFRATSDRVREFFRIAGR